MSAMMLDLRPVSHREALRPVTAGAGHSTGHSTGHSHPRGRGFEVLSRIARTRAWEDDGYSPRHRLETEPDGMPADGR